MKINTSKILFVIIRTTCALLLGLGLYETFLGWQQLLGLRSSGHYLYSATGSFYNPGPYCCFLAVLTPIALYNILLRKKGFITWESIAYLIFAIGVMPSLMGRTGWFAAFMGMSVAFTGFRNIKLNWKIIIPILIILTLVAVWFYLLKPTSALGRLLLWRNGIFAMSKNPLTGVGWRNVPGALGDAQEHYFSQNPDSYYVNVAGSPEYAFNEYLQIGIAFGMPVLLLFILILLLAFFFAWKSGQYGLAGGVFAFAIVCMASYPFQFPIFTVVVSIILILSLLCSFFKLDTFSSPVLSLRLSSIVSSAIILIFGTLIISTTEHISRLSLSWNEKRYSYVYSLWSKNLTKLDSLSHIYSEVPGFLFDYGMALRKKGEYEKSNEILGKGLQISSDPMFLNIIGRNYQDMRNLDLAESYYLRSINRLPGRFYPYYLLCKLYADSISDNPEKFLQTYKSAMKMDIKVMSPAIRDMKSELTELYDRCNHINTSNATNPTES